MLAMSASNPSAFSDSQESVFLDPSLMDHLQNDLRRDNIGVDFFASAIMEEPEKKCDPLTFYRQGEQHYQIAPNNPIPSREEMPGPLNFQVMLNNQTTSKNWVYSERLSKVFINMDAVLPLRFKWEHEPGLYYLRTRMVYSLEQNRSEAVIRCHNHMAMSCKANTDLDPNIVKHVVRCLETQSCYEELPGGHLSILTPLGIPEVGSMYVPVHFKFVCKNSCTSGMNRRATELIFTLEDERQQVLGRRRLQVRICSCPKRDKLKEETEASGVTQRISKKRKGESVDTTLHPLEKRFCTSSEDNTVCHLNLEILGKEEAMAVKRFAYDIMAGKALRTGQFEIYKPYLNKLLM